MTSADLIERIRQVLAEHRVDDRNHAAGVGCGCVCGADGLSDHSRHVAEEIVNRLQRRQSVGDEICYFSAWFDDELTKLEGAEKRSVHPAPW